MNAPLKPVRPITADERAAYARYLQSALSGPLFDVQPVKIVERIEQEVVRFHRHKSLVEALATGMLGNRRRRPGYNGKRYLTFRRDAACTRQQVPDPSGSIAMMAVF